ncbi:phospholipase [Campylobacter novaezeelandiae]|uniref:Phosphatidylcholine 1-acylhydrolase n=1 Tax=Campylobacter novaezeelandiae TaxID=2267891 RepID=A0A4V2JQF7_9BACT|nr:phospholipase A [Campylobacter novaezeelandiae]TBR80147.1 phospholipase [Campylobacter novaezeelandiae]
MNKFLLFILLSAILYANDFQKALEYEQKGEFKKAMQIYKKLALREQHLNIDSNTTLKNKDAISVKQESKTNLTDYIEKGKLNAFGIKTYKMNYFLPLAYNFASTNQDYNKMEAKFQISIKKHLFENLFGLNEKYYIAYTQTSWWQIYNHSSPFRETNYQPEFFVDFPQNNEIFKNLRLGLLHESNGQGDENLRSRSWNRIYLSSSFLYGNFLFTPRIWYRIPESKNTDDNPAIIHYMGNFDINLTYFNKKFFVNTLIRNNLKFSNNKGALQIDLGYDLFDNGIYWYLQYFNGYGESLIDFNKKVQRLSSGFLISY